MGLNDWFASHLWVTYLMIVVFIVYIYNKVFRVGKLPILKELITYVLISIGSFLLLIFQIDANLPIVQSLFVAIVMMVLYRMRVIYMNWKNKDRQ